MKDPIRLFAATALCLVLAMPAAAADQFEPAGPPRTFDFDTPDGHFLDDDTPVTCPINAVRGTVRFMRYGQATTTYVPGFNIILLRDAKPAKRFVSMSFHARNFHPPFAVALRSASIAAIAAVKAFHDAVGADGVVTFLVSWSADGEVAGTSSGESLTADIGGYPDVIELEGYSGAGTATYEFGHEATE